MQPSIPVSGVATTRSALPPTLLRLIKQLRPQLLHHRAPCCQGIGTLRGAEVDHIDHRVLIRVPPVVLGLWGGGGGVLRFVLLADGCSSARCCGLA